MKNKKIIVFIGYSGAGKTTAAKICEEDYGIPRIITTTTRKKRKNEIEGVDYHFLNKKDFDGKIMVESDTYMGNQYGTSVDAVECLWKTNDIICTVMTFNGMEAMVNKYPGQTYPVFINADMKDIEGRLRNRGDSEDSIRERMKAIDKCLFQRIFCQYEISNQWGLNTFKMDIKHLIERVKREEGRQSFNHQHG